MDARDDRTLLAIGRSIAAVREAPELLRIVLEQLRPHFDFYDCGILVLDRDHRTFRDLAVLHPEIDGSAVNERLSGAGYYRGGGLEFSGSAFESVIAQLEKNGGEPILFDYTADLGGYSDRALQADLRAGGYREALVAPLASGGATFGALFLNARAQNRFRPEQFAFFQAVADLVAVAVSNVLANEEAAWREREKSLLLEISRTISEADNLLDLLGRIDALLKPIFGHTDAGVLVADRERRFVTDYHALYHQQIPASDEARRLNQIGSELGLARMPLPGSLVEWAMTQPPMHGALADLPDHGLDAPFLEYELAEGLTHYFNAPFAVSGETFGLCVLLFDAAPDPALLPLFAQATNVIAPALSSILAREEVAEREREKTLLLEITELIAQVKSSDDLLRLIVEKIKPLFDFHDCGLFVLGPDGETHTDLATVVPAVSPSDWSERVTAVSADIRHPGSLIEWMIAEIGANNHEPVLFDFADMVRRFPDYAQFRDNSILELGYRDCLAANLIVRGEVIGLLCINALAKNHFRPQTFGMFQAVAQSVAIAVANILANEQVARLAEERRLRAEELAQTNRAVERSLRRLAGQATPHAFVTGLHHELCELLGGECTAQFRLDWDAQRVSGGVIVDKGELLTGDDSGWASDVSVDEVSAWRGNLKEDRVLRFDMRRDRETISPPTVRFMEERGYTWFINLPLFVRERPAWVVAVLGRDDSRLTGRNLELFRQLARQLTLALELKQLSEEAQQAAVAREREHAAQERAAELALTNRALRESVEQLSGLDDLDAFLAATLNAASAATGAVCAAIFLFDDALETARLHTIVLDGQAGDPENDAMLAVWRRGFSLGESYWRNLLRHHRERGGVFRASVDEPFLADAAAWHRARGHSGIVDFPLQRGAAGGQLFGVFGLAFGADRAGEAELLTATQTETVYALAQQATLALELARLSAQARREAEVGAALEERNRIARDIHDTLAQTFTGISMRLEIAGRVVRDRPGEAWKLIEAASGLAREGLGEARRSVMALSSGYALGEGLTEGLRSLLGRATAGTPVRASFGVSGRSRPLPPETGATLFRVAQEAITNALRHADPDAIEVTLSFADGHGAGGEAGGSVRLTVQDDGGGFDPATVAGGFGLGGMRRRAERVGASLEIDSRPGRGTRVAVAWPKETGGGVPAGALGGPEMMPRG